MKTITVRIDYDSETKTYGATSEDLFDVYAVSDDREDVPRRFISLANVYLEYLRGQNKPLPVTLESHPEIVTVVIEAA
jgi:predicted RNase H-like HicB family nuclease